MVERVKQPIFTAHGTVLYLDERDNAVKHGIFETSPKNLVATLRNGKVLFETVGPETPLGLSDAGKIVLSKTSLSSLEFEPLGMRWGRFGLKHKHLFASSEPDGSLVVDRQQCSEWEAFHFRDDFVEVSGTIESYRVEGHQISFFVTNRNDEIQIAHVRGTFYERGELEVIRGHCKPEMVAVDVGANIGNHAVYLSKLCGISRLLVFEPNPSAINILRINLALNACSNVDTRYLGYALGSKPSTYTLADEVPNNMGMARVVESDQGELRSIVGDELLIDVPVGFIKIDVEGMEFDVLAGLANTINRWRPNLFVEVWSDRRDTLDSWLVDNNYRIAWHFFHNYLLLPN